MNIVLLFFLTVSTYSFINSPNDFNIFFMWGQIIICVISILVWKFHKENDNKIKKQVLKHSNIYIIGYLIVFYQYPLDYLLGFVGDDLHNTWIDSSVVCKSLSLSNIGLLAFIVGYQFRKKKAVNTVYKEKNYFYNKNLIYVLELTLFVLLILYYVFVDKEYLLGGYGIIENEGNIAAFINKMFVTTFIILLSLKIIEIKQSKHIISTRKFIFKMRILLLCMLYFILAIIMSGARHQALILITMMGLSYLLSTKKKVSVIKVIILFLLFSFFFSLQGLVRGEIFNGKLISNVSEASKELSGISFSPLTKELAGSINTLNCALFYVPEYYPYNFGITIYGHLFLLIPGGRSAFLSVLNVPEILHSSSNFLTFLMFGYNPAYGIGSSSVADIYISFGAIGVCLIFFLWGYLIRKIEYKSFSDCSSIYSIIISLVIYSQLIFISRESLFTFLFGISYPLLFVYLLIKSKYIRNEYSNSL